MSYMRRNAIAVAVSLWMSVLPSAVVAQTQCTPAINIAVSRGALLIRSDEAFRAIHELWRSAGLPDPGNVVLVIITPAGDGLIDVHPVVDGRVCSGLIMTLGAWNAAENPGVNI